MKEPLTRLIEKTSTLGNYNRKYLHIISTTVDRLTAALERESLRDRVHLWSYSLEIPGEMDTVLEPAANEAEKLDFLGCYFALQFLHMNLRMIDIVKLELATGPERWQSGKRLMLEAGRMFRFLTKNYMERLLRIFHEGQVLPEYVILGVGTRADQDDIDMGVIYRGNGDVASLNRAIARLWGEMFRKATRLHFHLSEHVRGGSFSATIEDYDEMLKKGVQNFVIITEMLGAAFILGDYSLFEDFRRRITSRFYYDSERQDNRYHEGYLRGILGEIRSQLTRLKTPKIINPKEDGLRPIKSLLSALKTVYGVDKVNAWDTADGLKEKNPQRKEAYGELEQALSFFELFRHLYQIMVAQDEDINLDEPGIEDMLAEIAEIMGFEGKGVVSAREFMLVNYYEYLDKSISAIDMLSGDLQEHLHGISVVRPILSRDIHHPIGYQGNLAEDFIRVTKFFRGITYWDDFLKELSDPDNVFYNEFIRSFQELPEKMKLLLATGYVSGARYGPASILKLLVIVGEKARDDQSKAVFTALSRAFIDELRELPDVSASLIHMAYAFPELLNTYLSLIDWDSLSTFTGLAHSKPYLPELVPLHNQLLTLCGIHHQSSQFFKRHFVQIMNKYPLYIKNLHNDERLREIANGFYSGITTVPNLKERMERLGVYYDLEFVRVSLLAMNGAHCEQTDNEFTEFCDNYAQALYELCQQEVHLNLGYSMRTHDLFALYAAGGHAREQGFDDDYDMIVILDSTDPDQIDYCNRIIGRMNSEILKRGILTHHRFADHFGSYVVSFAQMAEHLKGSGDDIFVDKSQILGSRLLEGSRNLDLKLEHEIIYPLIFECADQYIEQMREEMRSRHKEYNRDECHNIKECCGGLRDIEMLLLMYKTRYKVREPSIRKLLRRLMEVEPANAQCFKYVEDHFNFIKKLRDLYRLKVAPRNVIEKENMAFIAPAMGYGDSPLAGDNLYNDFMQKTSEAASEIKKLVDSISLRSS
jgi:hypothetical protein